MAPMGVALDLDHYVLEALRRLDDPQTALPRIAKGPPLIAEFDQLGVMARALVASQLS